MPLTDNEVFDISRATVIESITNFIRNREGKVPNFQILDLIIPTERKIRSVVGGMETSLGTTLWEPLAKNLATNNGFEIVNKNLEAPTNMPGGLQNTLQLINEGRLAKNSIFDSTYCHNRIKEVCQTYIETPITEFKSAPKGFGVDIWLRKDGTDYFFDTKTVQSNVGSYTRYINQIFNWYAYFYSKNPLGSANARIVFPYNPYGDEYFWDKTIGKGFPLEPNNEGWVENQFWDFCSGIDNTYSQIHQAFISISESGELEEIIQEIFYGKD